MRVRRRRQPRVLPGHRLEREHHDAATRRARGFVARGQAKCALVIGAEEMTRLMDWTDRTTCVLFGDGAGAVVLEPREGQGTSADQGMLGFALRAIAILRGLGLPIYRQPGD